MRIMLLAVALLLVVFAPTGGVCGKNRAYGCFPAIAGTAGIGPSIPRRLATLAGTPPAVPVSRRKFIPTCSVTASPPTCWKLAPTCTPFRSY